MIGLGVTGTKVALITGVTGMDGAVMSRMLLRQGIRVVGVKRRSSTENLWRIKDLLDDPNFTVVEGDITDLYSMVELIKAHKPHYVMNFAAQSHVATSYEQPQLTFEITARGAINVINACRLVDPSIRIFQASTSEMFGSNYSVVDDKKVQDHNTPFHPRSPYAVSKQAAHDYSVVMRESYGMFICPTILFNHTHTTRGENFLERKVTRYVGRLKHSLSSGRLLPKLKLGNIYSFRDIGWSEDYMEAVWLILNQNEPDDYILATGKTHQIKDILELAFGSIGEDFNDHIEIDQALYRPAEVDYLCGSPKKIVEKLGWRPKTELNEIIRRMVEFDYQLARNE